MRVFVTGATGFIGSAVVQELLGAGHQVLGLARSEGSAEALAAAGAEVFRGSLDDIEALHAAAAASGGVVHLAFKHEEAFSGDFPAAASADLRVIETFGAALAGSGKPLVIASGISNWAPGRVLTEADPGDAGTGGPRVATEGALIAIAERGVRTSAVRLAPTVHGGGDRGFLPALIGIARETGVSAYVGDGPNRWPAVHRLDAARLFRLALEGAPGGTRLHAVAEEGLPFRVIAEVIGRRLNLPVVSKAAEEATDHFGFLASVVRSDMPASSTLTRELLGWETTQPGLTEDLEHGSYFGS